MLLAAFDPTGGPARGVAASTTILQQRVKRSIRKRVKVLSGLSASWVIIASLAVLACQRGKQNDQSPVPSASGTTHSSSAAEAPASAPLASPVPTTSAAASAVSANAAQAGKRAAKGPPITAAQLQRYQAALGTGRLATQHRDWAAAERAFGEALTAIPDDARAHSERGYARLLQGDLKGAGADFDKAFGASDDPKLSAQIWFNRGLVAERNGNADQARSFYARSLQFNPTRAARAKLEGKTLCPAGVTRIVGEDYPSWLAVWNELTKENAATYAAKDPPPTDDKAARAAYGIEACTGLCVGYAQADRNLHAFLQLENGAVRVFRDVYGQSGGRCEGQASIEARGDVMDLTTFGWTVEFACDTTPCRDWCSGPGEWRSVSLVLEPNERKRLLVVDRAGEGEKPEPRVLSAPGGARVDLPSCDMIFPFAG